MALGAIAIDIGGTDAQIAAQRLRLLSKLNIRSQAEIIDAATTLERGCGDAWSGAGVDNLGWYLVRLKGHLRRAVARRRSGTKVSYIAGRRSRRCHGGMTSIRIIKHEAIPQTGSYEVKFTDGRPSIYHYFDDNPGRRSIRGKMTSAQALEKAKALAGISGRPAC